jgi:hypothetical protein
VTIRLGDAGIAAAIDDVPAGSCRDRRRLVVAPGALRYPARVRHGAAPRNQCSVSGARTSHICADCCVFLGLVVPLSDDPRVVAHHAMQHHAAWHLQGLQVTTMLPIRPRWERWSNSSEWLVLAVGRHEWGTPVIRGSVRRVPGSLGGKGWWSAEVVCEDDPCSMDKLGDYKHRWQAKLAVSTSRCGCLTRAAERYRSTVALLRDARSHPAMERLSRVADYWWSQMPESERETSTAER